ncbi:MULTISPECIES: hybrid sensor histidine kinase/response regulator transcription factor [Niastella]|uniref:histidine kinase n=1 Tax=Niastella soli TaxID=2821487 RepID=A0ABS3YYD5_9BACT|nr:two-component regulator propeller domain-containing protein [Niastella soli]MBO9202928.1 response regulator [Niastella soli]
MCRPFSILFVFCLLLCLYGNSQQLLFRNYTVADGLSSNTVRAIKQDDQGFMWFGTKNGVSRFDGYQFKLYQFKKDNPASLGNNFIHAIEKADSTHLWIGTENGIYILDLQTERFEPLPELEGKVVFDLLKDKAGAIWITTRLHGLYRYTPTDKKMLHLEHKEQAKTLSSDVLTKLALDNNGNLWIGTYGNGLDVLDTKTMEVTNYDNTKGVNSNFIIALYKDQQGKIWAGTMNGGVCVYDPATRLFKTYNKTSKPAINDDIVRSICQASPGIVYIGTEKGLNVLNEATGNIASCTNDPADPLSISDNSVYSIYPDRTGIVWVGTFFGGVSYFKEKGSAFELYYPTGNANSLSGRAVSCFLEDAPGKFWIGTEDGGLNYFNTKDKSFRQYPFLPKQQKLSYHNIHVLMRDKKGLLWIGLFAGGINVYDAATGKVKQYKHQIDDAHSLNSDNVFSLYEDKEGEIWVGTDRGLNWYDAANDRFVEYTRPGVHNTIVYDMYEDASKNMWFATYNNGLHILNKRTGEWQSITTGNGGLTTNKLTCLHDDNNGNVWVGTDGGGLHRINRQTKQVTVYDKAKGINANVIYSVLEDDEGQLWVSTNDGIYSLHMSTGKVKHFTHKDNLQSRQFNYKAGYKAFDGNLLMGGVKGFNMFNPLAIGKDTQNNKVIITAFQLFNKEVPVSTDGPLQQSINYTGKVSLSHDQSVFSFEFAGVNFSTPEKVRYAYKMEGFDTGWNYVNDERKATYTNLSPGTYRFLVKATADDNNWNSEPASVKVVIRPPFYRSTLAYVIYVLLFIASLYWAFYYVENYHRRKNQARLEKMKVKEEQEFYARKIEFFTVMAHEIRTPLSLIMAPLERLLSLNKWQAAEQEQLQLMEENSNRLMSLVNQLLDFRRIESDAYTIHKEEVEVVSLVQSLYSRFSSLPYQKGVEFSMSTRVNRLEVQADPEVLNKVVSNLLINAFKFTRTKVTISINDLVTGEDGRTRFSVTVEDDGIGISASDSKHIFKKFFTTTSGNYEYHNLGGSGIGLALAAALAEKHGGQLLVESKEGVKTAFTLELPYESISNTSHAEEELVADAADKLTVLVAEDDDKLLDFIAKSLRADGFAVEKATNGKEALQVLEQKAIDLILSDVMMPELSGFELCRVIKNNVNYSHIPFIILTAKSNTEAELEGLQAGADAYITKPFKWKHVVAIVKNLLESRERLRLKFSEQPAVNAEVLTTNTRDKEFMERIMAIIEQRMTDPQLSVEELSKELAMSRSNLHKKLKILSGMGPNELIRLIRLKHAAKLLTKQQHTVAEVAYLSGFSSPSYFTKCFQQQFKVGPKEYGLTS